MTPIGPQKAFQPDGRRTVTPRIITHDVGGMVEFLRSVFGALGEVRARRDEDRRFHCYG
jgi:hypothetical protein